MRTGIEGIHWGNPYLCLETDYMKLSTKEEKRTRRLQDMSKRVETGY